MNKDANRQRGYTKKIIYWVKNILNFYFHDMWIILFENDLVTNMQKTLTRPKMTQPSVAYNHYAI